MQNVSINRSLLLTGHEGSVYALERSSSPGKFFSGGSDRIVCEWSLDESVPPAALVNVGAIIYSIRLVEDKNLLFIGTSSGRLHVIDLTARKEIRNIAHHAKGIFDISFSVETDRLYTGSGDGHFSVWRLSDLSLLSDFRLCQEKVRSIAIHPSKGEIALACGDGRIVIADGDSGKQLRDWKAHETSANAITFSPSGDRILSGGRDAHLNCWDATSGALIRSIPAHNYAIYSISYSPDTRFIATGSRDKTVKLWDADSLDLLLRIDKEKFEGHRNSVNKLMWMYQPLRLISTGDDRSVMVWKSRED
ncbi:MAG: WD40 repeat domain-containing protein [Bacteroidota bacterium]